MWLILKLAWRNVLRNPRRTGLSALAVGIGLAAMIFVSAFLDGTMKSMIRTATDTFMGQGQIHAEGFRDAREVENTVKDSARVLDGLSHEPLISAFAPRTISSAMLSSPANVAAVVLYGLEAGAERRVSRLSEAVVEGQYLRPDHPRDILIGWKAAETLEVELGDRVVITVAQAGTGELMQEMFRVSGTFRFGVREADSAMAYINLDEAQRMLALGGRVHEIALRFTDIDNAGDESLPLWSTYSAGGNEALGWRSLLPQLDGVLKMSELSTAITMALIFCIVAITVMNTLFMSIYERMFEFGVLRAVGTRPLRMALIIVFEALSISAFSTMAGLALGAAVTAYFASHGIDYVGIEFAGITIRELIYPVLSIGQVTVYPLVIVAFCLLASVYPAYSAARIAPAGAMRRSL